MQIGRVGVLYMLRLYYQRFRKEVIAKKNARQETWQLYIGYEMCKEIMIVTCCQMSQARLSHAAPLTVYLNTFSTEELPNRMVDFFHIR